LSNELLGGFTDFAKYGSALSAAQMSIKPCSYWPARSSAGGTLSGFVRRTKGPTLSTAGGGGSCLVPKVTSPQMP
jgi:hypothetical protein